MRSIRRWAVVVLVASFVCIWRVETDRDVAAAQMRKTIPMVRVYTGSDGLSHAERIEMAVNGDVTEMMKATGVQFARRAPYLNDWHTGPRRQFVITLSGRAELEMGDGQKVAIGPGHISLIEDTTGKGHTTRVIGPDDRITVTIPLADQRPDGDKRTVAR